MMGKVGGTLSEWVMQTSEKAIGAGSTWFCQQRRHEAWEESDQSLSVLSALGYSCHNVVTCLYVYSTCAGPTGFVLQPSASKGAWHPVSVQILVK